MKQTKKGRQEPTASFVLPYTETDGDIAAELYAVTGRQALPWQEALIYDILAKDETGRWIHSKFGLEIPRRNGKNEILIIRELYALAIGEKVLHTAHLITTAHAAWKRLTERLDAAEIVYKSIKAKGQELIELDNGGRIEFRTRTAKGGLGEGFDLLVIDEAQEYQTDQESALKYVVTDSRNPQTIYTGTPPTPISSGTVFKTYRSQVLAGTKERSGWAEWSVDEIKDPNDRANWYETNPSLGYTLDEVSIADEVSPSKDAVIDFNIQRLGLWIRHNLKSAISKTAWTAIQSDTLPRISGKLVAGVKFSKDGESAALAIGARTEDGRVFVEVIDRRLLRDGTEWIIEFLRQIQNQTLRVIVDGANGQQMLAAEMQKNGLSRPFLPTVKQIIDANQRFEKGIFERTLTHMDQPTLTAIVSACEHRAIGNAGGFGFKPINTGHDVAIMDAAILAAYGAETFKDVKQRISY